MTDEQRAEMTRLDAAIAATPDDAVALEMRARLWASCPHLDESFADCLAAWLLCSDVSAQDWAARGENYLARSPRFIGPETNRWTLVQAATCFSLALQGAPDNPHYHTRRARAWIDIGNSGRAAQDLKKARQLDGESAERFHLWARVYEKNHAIEFASDAYKSALRIEIEAQQWPRDLEFYARQAAQMKARWQERAWLDLALEGQPDNPAWLRWRADLLSHSQQAAAFVDYSRLIEMAPDDLALYEARARCAASTTHYYEIPIAERPDFPSQSQARADFAHVLRVQIARGEQCGETWFLRMCGDEIRTHKARGYSDGHRQNLARAHAFYSVAIERAPGEPGLYMARAGVTTPDFPEPSLFADPKFADYLSALRLKPNFRAPRKKIAGILARTFANTTAHEQLEALLGARAELRARGLRPKLIGQIMREVERALAT